MEKIRLCLAKQEKKFIKENCKKICKGMFAKYALRTKKMHFPFIKLCTTKQFLKPWMGFKPTWTKAKKQSPKQEMKNKDQMKFLFETNQEHLKLNAETQKLKWKYKPDLIETKAWKDAKWKTNAQSCIQQ